MSGLIDIGPVVPLQPPSTFAQMMCQRFVSMPRPGPTMPSHQPLGFVSPGRMPATCASPVSAWQMKIALSSRNGAPHSS